ncbi:MAG: TolB family protein [Fibrobacterota bacterium]
MFRIFFLVLFLFIPVLPYSGYGLDYNNSHIKWKAAESENFRVHYPKGMRDAAQEAVLIAETVYEPLRDKYGLGVNDKVDFLVYDEDNSNGYAIAVLNQMAVWVSDLGYNMRGTHNWLRDVVTHELAHVVSIQTAFKLHRSIPFIGIGYFDYFNEKNSSSWFAPVSMDILPPWFYEGIAQYESSRNFGDDWDTHRDMVLRTASLGGGLLSYDKMSHFVGKSPDFEKAYNQGFSMCIYISQKYGEDALAKMCRESMKLTHQSFKPVVKKVLGVSASELYDDWKSFIRSRYKKQLLTIGKQVFGRKISKNSFKNRYPRFSDDGKYLFFLSNPGEDYGFTNLFRFDLEAEGSSEDTLPEIYIPGIRSAFDFHPGNDSVLYFSSMRPDSIGHGAAHFDIVRKNITGDIFKKPCLPARITRYQRARFPDIHPEGNKLLFVLREGRKTFIAECDTGKLEENKRVNKEYRKIFPSPEDDRIYNIVAPKYSPDGQSIVFSYFEGEKRNIGLVDKEGFRPLTDTKADERDPVWMPDQGKRKIIYSSDESGIFNLYLLDLNTGMRQKITNVSGGAFEPAVSPDGRKVAYVNYDTSGFSVYILDSIKAGIPEHSVESAHTIKTYSDIPDLSSSLGREYSYKPVPRKFLAVPMLVGEKLVSDDPEAERGKHTLKAGLMFSLSDVLDKNTISFLFLNQIDKGSAFLSSKYAHNFFLNPEMDREYSLSFVNRSLPPVLIADYMKVQLNFRENFWDNTVLNNDGTTGDSVKTSYVVDISDYYAGARLQINPLLKIHAGLNHYRSGMNYYEEPAFRFNYFNYTAPTVFLTALSKKRDDRSMIDPRGIYFKLKLDRNMNNLMFRGNDFTESFYIDDKGIIKPNMIKSAHNELRFDLKFSENLPAYIPALAGMLTAGMVDFGNIPGVDKLGEYYQGFWSIVRIGGFLTLQNDLSLELKDRPVDDFFHSGVDLPGFSYLKNDASYTYPGRNKMEIKSHLRFPIWKTPDIGAGPIFFHRLFGEFEYGMGRASGLDTSRDGLTNISSYYRLQREEESYIYRENISGGFKDTLFSNKVRLLDFIEERNLDPSVRSVSMEEIDTLWAAAEDDMESGFGGNLRTLSGRPFIKSFGSKIRLESYLYNNYPFCVSLGYYVPVKNSMIETVKNYFTVSPFNNSSARIIFDIGFSFDNWDLIDNPAWSRRGKFRRK